MTLSDTTKSFSTPNLEESIYLIRHLGDANLMGKRRKIRSSEIKILYQIHLYGKNIKRGKWNAVFPSRSTIASHAGISEESVKRFICSDHFKIFGSKQERQGTSNIYHLKRWVVDLFDAFERVGMMKGFSTNFGQLRITFFKRLNMAFIPLIQKGHSLNEVMNKLSTKSPLKLPDQKSLKLPATTYPSDRPFTTSYEYKTKIENPTIPVVNDFVAISRILFSRFHLKEGDINQVLGRYDLYHHKRAAREMNLWMQRGMDVQSPIRTYQKCLNLTKR